MKKRLDLQSLLEECQKEDLVRFLRTRFAKSKALANDFLIHFASTFELDESEFQLIMDRIRGMFPARISGITHRKAQPIKIHLQDLMEQTRDCLSRQDYRQAFIIISHVILLFDEYIDQIPDKFGFKKLQTKSYELLDQIYQGSPAPALKSRLRSYLKQMIHTSQAIPFHDQANPYILLLQWEEKPQIPTGRFLINALTRKTEEYSEYQHLWIPIQIQILITLKMDAELIGLIEENRHDRIVYESLNRYLSEKPLSPELTHSLKTQYSMCQDRRINHLIYKILKNRSAEIKGMNELTIQEFFASGNLSVLENLLADSHLNKRELISHLKLFSRKNPDVEHFYLYSAYRFLNQSNLLKNLLLKENDVFEIVPFLHDVYPDYKEEIRTKMADLIEKYLSIHFGRPAIQYINDLMEEINRLGLHGLQDYLMQKIRKDFGHRKHFQKLMKELVQ